MAKLTDGKFSELAREQYSSDPDESGMRIGDGVHDAWTQIWVWVQAMSTEIAWSGQ